MWNIHINNVIICIETLKIKVEKDFMKKNTQNNSKPKSIELFAGAGGLALGLEEAGFEHIGLIEFEKDAAATLTTNRPNWNVICDDIANVAKDDLEKLFSIKKYELDLLSGGAPCQSFSYAGKRLGLEDTRGTMFYHYAAFLHKLQPKMFLFENVKGLLTHDKGRTYKTILDIFKSEGYTVSYKVLNAWDYGVPQKRERLITIGVRNDLAAEHKISFPKKHAYKPLIKDVKLEKNPNSQECERYSKEKEKVFKLVPPGGYWRDIDPEIAKKYMKSCWDMGGGRTGILRRIGLGEPSLTVLTSPGMKQTDRCHPLEVRPFSIRENARIQTFPDEWEFKGNLQSKYRQIGNAVPVNLAKDIGLSIIGSLNGESDMWDLNFILEKDFTEHVENTIKEYRDSLKSYNVTKFNKNIIDPIKLTFDKMVYSSTWEEVIKNEIYRQRDKSNNNYIGYFHQNIFKYINNCKVPPNGWDVIYSNGNNATICNGYNIKTVYVEMKNKHNTMNDASSKNTYIKMQNQVLKDENCACCLVEAIAKKSQNIKWKITLNKEKVEHDRIRRVSMDKFYEMVTGDENAFYNICMILPAVIKKVIDTHKDKLIPQDTVFSELKNISNKYKEIDNDIAFTLALYMLGFSNYNGFNSLEK